MLATAFLIFVAFIAFVAMLFMPDASLKGAYSGTMLCIEKVIPALFPFFVCTGILTGSGVPQLLGKVIGKPFEKLFGINKNCAFAFVTGLLCGYPLGAKVVGDMYQQKMKEFEEKAAKLKIGTVTIEKLS